MDRHLGLKFLGHGGNHMLIDSNHQADFQSSQSSTLQSYQQCMRGHEKHGQLANLTKPKELYPELSAQLSM